jgi:hypothetical protein
MATWSEKLSSSKVAQKKLLDKSVAGMPAGALMYISTPQEIDQYINLVPFGNSKTIQQMRDEFESQRQQLYQSPYTSPVQSHFPAYTYESGIRTSPQVSAWGE